MVDKEKFYDTAEARKKLDNNYPSGFQCLKLWEKMKMI